MVETLQFNVPTGKLFDLALEEDITPGRNAPDEEEEAEEEKRSSEEKVAAGKNGSEKIVESM